MSGSYEKINYSLRPAKSIERKMLCEAFKRLSEFRLVSSYRYIGLGSTYFSDFSLFHKELDIKQMISIERDVSKRERFEFNKPYQCIEIEFGNSSEVLPTLVWDNVRTIVWLDYDGELDREVLNDIGLVCSKIAPGSIFLISINVHPLNTSGNTNEDIRLNHLKEKVGDFKVPPDTLERDLSKWGLASVCRQIFNNEVEEILSQRNGTLPRGSKIKYKQLFNFNYSDNAKMLTVGGILYDEGEEVKVLSCGFENLQFVKIEDVPYLIEIPVLTKHEIQYLNKQLPTFEDGVVTGHGIPNKDVNTYAKVYRYFPNFTEIET